ncbi:MAG: cupin domain-containing protein [Candidatus Kapaibacteriales bacterium]
MSQSLITPENIFNLHDFSYIPEKEFFRTLFENRNIKIEKIVSKSHSSPEGFWYDQDLHEWVILLSGSAELEFKNPDQIVELQQGDYILIPPHKLHRVVSTSVVETIWLAIFF